VLDRDGKRLAMRASAVAALDEHRLAAAPSSPPGTLQPERLRTASSNWRHGSDDYRIVVWTSLDQFDREHAEVMNTIRIAIPFAALAALTGGWLIVWRALRPLAAMAARVDAIDRRHLDATLPVPAPRDELQRLALAFNGLLGRLSDSIGAQRRFMAEASHELRTPVTIARTAAQVTLSAPHRSEPEYREALDIVATQAGRLSHIVDDMFLLALADVQGRALLLRYIYLDELVIECVRAAGVLAESRRIAIRLTSQEGVQGRGDEELLRRMVMNLLDNAVRYSPDGSQVDVAIVEDSAVISLTIADHGPGIPVSEQERIFERFVRLETARATAGGGLGLPIARWIAEQHGGELRLEASEYGCRFVVTLPQSGHVPGVYHPRNSSIAPAVGGHSC
jgi:two-component system OmpR family sensor kinase